MTKGKSIVLLVQLTTGFTVANREKDKTPNHDSVVLVQDDRMGFHICIVGY